jgi:hypothetical protein
MLRAKEFVQLLRPLRRAVRVLHGSNGLEALSANALTQERPFELTTLVLGERDRSRGIAGADKVFGLRIGL